MDTLGANTFRDDLTTFSLGCIEIYKSQSRNCKKNTDDPQNPNKKPTTYQRSGNIPSGGNRRISEPSNPA